MADTRQLALLEGLAAERSEAHAIQLAKARQHLAAAERQLAQLRDYQSGYQTQLGQKLEAAVSIETLRGHHRFMQNIAAAVRQQEIEVARRRAGVDAIDRAWRDSEHRRRGFKVMVGKVDDANRRAEARQQQKSSDEFAARKHDYSDIGL